MTKETKVACIKLLGEKLEELKLNAIKFEETLEKCDGSQQKINQIRERIITYESALKEIEKKEITE